MDKYKMILQVQPRLSEKEEWKGLSEKEGLSYELLEFSMPGRLSGSLREEGLSYYRNTGRAVSFHGAFIDVNPASAEPEIRKISREMMEKSCLEAVEAGCTDLVFHAGAHPFLNGIYLQSWARNTADYYSELFEKYGVRIHAENSADAYPDALSELMEALSGRAGVDICLDIGHANYSKTPLSDWFSALGETIGYVHLSDNQGKYDDHLPVGSGTVLWEVADRLIRKYHSVQKITIEMNSLEDVKTSLSYIRARHLFEQNHETAG